MRLLVQSTLKLQLTFFKISIVLILIFMVQRNVLQTYQFLK